MGKKRAALSKGETVVASAIWRLEKGSLGEIHQEVLKSSKMEYSTVQSYIRRLETKGYIQSKRLGRNYVYFAKVKPDQVIGQTVNQMISQLFDGSAIPLFRHLLQKRGVSDDELREIKGLIEQAENQEGDEGESVLGEEEMEN